MVVILAVLSDCNEWVEIEPFVKDKKDFLKDYFDEEKLLLIESGYKGLYLKSIERSHGEIIKYEYFQTEDVKWYSKYKNWEKLRSIDLV